MPHTCLIARQTPCADDGAMNGDLLLFANARHCLYIQRQALAKPTSRFANKTEKITVKKLIMFYTVSKYSFKVFHYVI